MGSYKHMLTLVTAILVAARDIGQPDLPPLEFSEHASNAAELLEACGFADLTKVAR